MRKQLLALASLALAGSLSLGIVTASASSTTTKVLQDTFNDVNYSNSYNSRTWKTYVSDESDPSISQTEASNLSLKVSRIGTSTQLVSASRFTDIESVQFDVCLSSGSEWFALNFVNDQAEYSEGFSGNAGLYKNPMLIRVKEISNNTVTFDQKPSYQDMVGQATVENTWLTIKVVPQDQTNADVFVGLQGEELPSKKDFTMTWKDKTRSFTEGYLAFASASTGTYELIDNVIVNAGGETYTEDFSAEGSVTWEERAIWRCVGNTTGLALFDNSSLKFEDAKASDRIISVGSIKEDTSVITDLVTLEAEFIVKFEETAADTDEIAFVFNLSEQKTDPTKGSYAYVMNKNGGRLEKYDENGKVELEKSYTNMLWETTSREGSLVKITVSKDGEMIIYEGGQKSATFKGVDGYAGYFGFAALSDCASTVTLDNVLVNNTTYYVPKTKSVTHNFSNDFFGNEGYEDFVVEELPENSLYVKDGKLVMEGASDGTFFGSAHQYDSFIMDFKLCNIYIGTEEMETTEKTRVNAWLGFDVSRQTKAISSYGSYAMFYFTIVPKDGVETVGLTMYTKDTSETKVDRESVSIAKVKDIPASYFKDIQYDGVNTQKAGIEAGDALCVRWVSENGILKLYMKKASESNFTLYYTISGLELNGYFALCNTGYMHVELDDFSMANTSPMYVCADNEAPEKIETTKEVIVYDKGNVDVNWEEELNLNASESGCGASIAAIGPIGVLLGAALALTKKRRK